MHVRGVVVAPLDGWGGSYLHNATLQVCLDDDETWVDLGKPSGADERIEVDAIGTKFRLHGSYMATSRLYFQCDETRQFKACRVPSTTPCDDVAWELEVDGVAASASDVESLLVQDKDVGVATQGDNGAILAQFEAPVHVSRCTVAVFNNGLHITLAGAKLEVLLDDDETWETVVELPDYETLITKPFKAAAHHMDLIEHTMQIDASGSLWRLRGKDVATSRFFFETNEKKGYKPAQILQGQPVDGQPWTLSVSNVYGSGSYGITSDDASKLLTEATNEGTGTYSGTSEICATFEEPVRVRGVTVAPLDGWGGSYLSNATLQVCLDDGESWLDLAKPSGAEETLEVDAVGSKFRLYGSYMATSRLVFA